MSEVIPYGGLFQDRQARAAGRALARLEARTQVEVTQIDRVADLQAARGRAVAYVGKRAMQEVAMISELELQLATMAPLAAARLQALADMTSLGMADVVADTVRRVR